MRRTSTPPELPTVGGIHNEITEAATLLAGRSHGRRQAKPRHEPGCDVTGWRSVTLRSTSAFNTTTGGR